MVNVEQGLSKDQIAKFQKDRKYMLGEIRHTAKLLRELAQELNLYGDQKASDIAKGLMVIDGVYVLISEGVKSMYIDHYPMEYLQSVAMLLEQSNKTSSSLGRWLVTRTILEAVYDRAKISLLDANKLDEQMRIKVRKYRTFQVLDFYLNNAQSLQVQPWINDYLAMRDYVSGLDFVTADDLSGFPGASDPLNASGEMRTARSRQLNKLSKGFKLKKPAGNELIYDVASRLAHANPMQLAMSQFTAKQWREALLADGRVVYACIDLLLFIFENVDTKHLDKIKKLRDRLETFYLDRLVSNWQVASRAELGDK